ncbi:MAG: tetratricopeptide repeat protein [Anaerovorax sp.]
MLGSSKEKAGNQIVERNPKEYDIKLREDRIGKYLVKHLKKFVFDELSGAYLEEKGKGKFNFMANVPIPLRKEDIEAFKSEQGAKVTLIAENMAWVMGADPKFKYRDAYLEFMKANFGNKATAAIVKVGRNAAEKEEYDDAAIHFRAALCVEPQSLDAMYSYARVCRAMYLEGKDEEYVGNFKAESLEFFELLIDIHPRFAPAHYYLGYAYLNLGLYMKAELVWKLFIAKTRNGKDKREIKERIHQLEKPIQVEKGYNLVLAGKWTEGIKILEPFIDSQYKDWWPLSYYLGIAYVNLGKKEQAIERFKHVLQISPSNVETMEELADIYRVCGDQENCKKYEEKANLLKSGGHKEKAFKSPEGEMQKKRLKKVPRRK